MHTYIHKCIYINIYSYMYTYIHAYIHKYIHIHNTYIQTYIPTYIHTHITLYVHTCIHTWIHTHIRNTYIHAYIHKYVHTHIIHTCMHTCINTYINIYVHIFIHAYIHTCIHRRCSHFYLPARYLIRKVPANAGFLGDKVAPLFTDINELLCDKGYSNSNLKSTRSIRSASPTLFKRELGSEAVDWNTRTKSRSYSAPCPILVYCVLTVVHKTTQCYHAFNDSLL
jgi:hypothetical protein